MTEQTTQNQTDPVAVGDVIEDAYGNPSIVKRVDRGRPTSILQLVGSDRGRTTYAPRRVVPVVDSRRAWAIEAAQKIAR